MVECNPVPRIRREWSDTKTLYGKVGMVVFYSLVWLTILTYIWSVVDPTSQGMDCIVKGIKGMESQALYVATLRGMAIMTLGFFLYAERGGFRISNVAVVTVVAVAFAGNGLTWATDLGCAAMYWSIVVAIVGSVLALVLVYLEELLGAPRGTGGERSPLM